MKVERFCFHAGPDNPKMVQDEKGGWVEWSTYECLATVADFRRVANMLQGMVMQNEDRAKREASTLPYGLGL